METVSSARLFGGTQATYRHRSEACACDMTFAVYAPPQAASRPVPVMWFLSGLTCTSANFSEKAGAQRVAAELGVMLVLPDTSPRGPDFADDPAYDFGQGAGFYVDATQAPWAANFQMARYVTAELPKLIAAEFAADMARQGITGHSMGGHGALTLALTNPGRYRSVSAFAPIVAPSQVPWGQKALGGYLGTDPAVWQMHDACALISAGHRVPELLIDQGEADNFLTGQLRPELLEAACAQAGIALTLRRQAGYDHSYWFVASFIEDHLRWHAARL